MIHKTREIVDLNQPVTLLLAATTGGHLTEGLRLFGDLRGIRLVVFSEQSTRTDGMKNLYAFDRRGKWTPGRFLSTFRKALAVIRKEKPRWVVTTGAECGVVAVLAAKVSRRRTIFVETACRYRSRSKTARILYHLVDVFLVQHEDSLKLFGKKARYIGGVFG